MAKRKSTAKSSYRMLWPLGTRVPSLWRVVEGASPPAGKIMIEPDTRDLASAWKQVKATAEAWA